LTFSKHFKDTGSVTTLRSVALASVFALGAVVGTAHAGSDTMPKQDDAQIQLLAQNLAQAAGDVSDEQLRSFSMAQGSIMAIQEEWQNRVDRGEVDPNDAQAIEDVRTQMAMTVEQTGLSVEDYNMIFETLQTDPELRERYQEMQ